jgi:hypothetical protein
MPAASSTRSVPAASPTKTITGIRKESHAGHIWAGGFDRDATFVDADHDINDKLDAVYRDKYRRYSAHTLDRIISPEARSTTIGLIPQ